MTDRISDKPLGAPTRRQAIALGLAMASSLALAEGVRPRRRLAEEKTRIALDSQVPAKFADWSIDSRIIPVLPDPGVQSRLDAIYSQVLARTYTNSRNERVMLTIAYGSDQASEATSVHRPEFCYSSQGFSVRNAGLATIDLEPGGVRVQRLVAAQGPRFEPLSYWVTLDERATLPGLGRKLEQLKFGMHGEIPDGMLVRVSTIGLDEQRSFTLQGQFVREMHAAIAPGLRGRYFGA